MSEESKAVRRARKREEASLRRAARALGYYQLAVAYRKLLQSREDFKRSNDEIMARTAALLEAGKNVDEMVKSLATPIFNSQDHEK